MSGRSRPANLTDQVRAYREQGLTLRQIQARLPGVSVAKIIRRHRMPVVRRRPDLPSERWLPVPGYEDRYEVSDLGRVWSIWNPDLPRTGVLMRPWVDEKGYQILTIWRNRDARKIGIHRLVMWAFVGPQPKGIEVRHYDGNPANNNLSNLRYGTPSENSHDKRRHGTDHNASKTHCVAGHPYTAENTYIRPRGGRTCRECKRQRWHRDADEINAARRKSARAA